MHFCLLLSFFFLGQMEKWRDLREYPKYSWKLRSEKESDETSLQKHFYIFAITWKITIMNL